ncbi:MAG: DUF3352 domain-containing protein [Nodosilinea sp.]
MKRRRVIIALVIVVGLVLGLILGRGWWGDRRSLALLQGSRQPTPETLQFVPKQSPLVVSLLARPDRLAEVWLGLAQPKQRPQIKQELAWLEEVLLAGTGLSYQQDLQPWLGEETTLAVVTGDLDQDPENGRSPGYLVIFTCEDGQAARKSLELFWQNRAIAGTPLIFKDAAGNRLIYTSQPQAGPSPLATTLVANRFLLVANHPEVLYQALGAAQAVDTNLALDSRYKTALKGLPSRRVGLVAMHLPGLQDWLQGVGAPALGKASPLPPNSSASLVDWGLISFALDRQGLLADLALSARPGRSLPPYPGDLGTDLPWLTTLPAALPLVAVGHDLARLGPSLQPLVDLMPAVWRSPLSLAQELDRRFGDGAMAAIQAGATQDYAVGLNPTATANPLDWLVLSHASPEWGQALETLNQLGQAQGLGASSLAIQQQPVRAWSRLQVEPQGQNLAVTAAVAGLETNLTDQLQVLAGSAQTLNQVLSRQAESAPAPPDWWAERDRFGSPVAAYLHGDWPRLQEGLPRSPRLELVKTLADPLLRHIQGITLANYGQSDRLQRSALFLRLHNR